MIDMEKVAVGINLPNDLRGELERIPSLDITTIHAEFMEDGVMLMFSFDPKDGDDFERVHFNDIKEAIRENTSFEVSTSFNDFNTDHIFAVKR